MAYNKDLYFENGAPPALDADNLNNMIEGINEALEKTDNQLSDESDIIQTSHISNDAVTKEKIADEAVDEEKIANAAVDEEKIANAAVTTDKVADKAITSDKIADESVTYEKLNFETIQRFPIDWYMSNVLGLDTGLTLEVLNQCREIAIYDGKCDNEYLAKMFGCSQDDYFQLLFLPNYQVATVPRTGRSFYRSLVTPKDGTWEDFIEITPQGGSGVITDEQVLSALETYFEENPNGGIGQDGADGKSAYELAVENGFEGTEDEWLDSLKGADGQDGEDGADYVLTDDDKSEIAQKVVEFLGDMPIFGSVDKNNNITITSSLEDGTYTLKYENADGSTSEIGTVIIGNSEASEGYTNLADPTDEKWVKNYRINSSGTEVVIDSTNLGSQTCVMTNLIDISNVDTVHIKGLDIVSNLTTGENYGRVYLYDVDGNYTFFTQPSAGTFYSTAEYDSNVTLIDVKGIIDYYTYKGNISYFRFGGILTGTEDGVIITTDENIEE